MPEPAMRDRILESAERRARSGGYHGFSFRDVAQDVGIKSASVHYHFPTKADLVEAVAHRYTERAQAKLATPRTAADAVSQVAALFRAALVEDDQMCLCGLLGAESGTVPDGVAAGTAAYFRMLLDYLADAWSDKPSATRPETVLSALEGALILARCLGDTMILDAVVEDLCRTVG